MHNLLSLTQSHTCTIFCHWHNHIHAQSSVTGTITYTLSDNTRRLALCPVGCWNTPTRSSTHSNHLYHWQHIRQPSLLLAAHTQTIFITGSTYTIFITGSTYSSHLYY
ncbi:hypothetical protein BsWGS_17963 [Bradybaena similaris]